MTARPGRFTQTQHAGYRHLNINVSEDSSGSPIRFTSQTTKAVLVLTCHKARLSVQDYFREHAR
ncbi:hypothetical protein DPMN_024006 [Dreissena polymorpha]|uniref:Uncharacterized protein n=1 Tax=Dreissena polymorpha TaxID=45954 RepID=A0A9D4LNY4_DREPO|nr:hypothetical protein DPMN_024006 [Dreissena polymorpha]